MITLCINGEARQLPAGLLLDQLVTELGHTGRRIAIERNGEIVPKSQYAQTALANGDKLEIVVAVGGG